MNSIFCFCVKNMVGPGEVDDLLDSKNCYDLLLKTIFLNTSGETKEECQKYGEVEKCLIYEVCSIETCAYIYYYYYYFIIIDS